MTLSQGDGRTPETDPLRSACTAAPCLIATRDGPRRPASHPRPVNAVLLLGIAKDADELDEWLEHSSRCTAYQVGGRSYFLRWSFDYDKWLNDEALRLQTFLCLVHTAEQDGLEIGDSWWADPEEEEGVTQFLERATRNKLSSHLKSLRRRHQTGRGFA